MGKRNPEPKYVTVKMKLKDVVNEAFCEFESLGEEMGEWRDNLEEKFSSTEKYQRVSDAADCMSEREEPEVPAEVGDVEIEVTRRNPKRPSRRGKSRADRCSDACMDLETVMEKLEALKEEAEQKVTDFDGLDPAQQEARKAEREKLALVPDAIQALWDELDNQKGEAEAAEFPGMYG